MRENEKLLNWQKEFDLYLDYSPAFIFEGEISDLQPSINEYDEMSLLTLNNYLYDELKAKGYECVVFFNHVDGFYNDLNNDEVKNLIKILAETNKSGNGNQSLSLTKDTRNSKFGDATEKIRQILKNTKHSVAIILDLASRYITSPTSLEQDEQYFYTELFLGIKDSKKVKTELDTLVYNNLILVADKINDIPTWFYLNNPNIKTLFVTTPNKETRQIFFEESKPLFYGYDEYEKLEDLDKEVLKRKFVDLTEGLKNKELLSLRDLMKKEEIDLHNLETGISLFKHGIRDNPWISEDLVKRLEHLETDLRKDVKGQDHAIKHVTDVVTRAIYGLSGVQHSNQYSKPRGIMFFAGPTGTGKTELAKSLTRWLFGNEEAFIRFDMSEYSQSHSDQRLLGAPPGYVGYEAGGQLTNAVKEKPFSILLFDEVEKADKSILDKFLQILEDGRMTDSKGETVYFNNTLIIFTSNLGISKIDPMTNRRIQLVKYSDDNSNYLEYSKKIMGGIDDYFINIAGRPELKNRIGNNFIVFEFINEETGRLIADNQIKKVINNLDKDKKITLNITDKARNELYEKIYSNLDQGGRGVGNAIENYLVNPLARFLAKNAIRNNKEITIEKFVFDNNFSELECIIK